MSARGLLRQLQMIGSEHIVINLHQCAVTLGSLRRFSGGFIMGAAAADAAARIQFNQSGWRHDRHHHSTATKIFSPGNNTERLTLGPFLVVSEGAPESVLGRRGPPRGQRPQVLQANPARGMPQLETVTAIVIEIEQPLRCLVDGGHPCWSACAWRTLSAG